MTTVDPTLAEARGLIEIAMWEMHDPKPQQFPRLDAQLNALYMRMNKRGRLRMIGALVLTASAALAEVPPERRKEILGWH